jgi:LacI family transcriptional regulator
MEDYLEPAKVAEQMRSMRDQTDVLAVVATDSPYISEAVDALSDRQVPVVALLSDLSAHNLAGYVGINNRIAGRTAAWAIARCADRPGSIGVLQSWGTLARKTGKSGSEAYFARGLGLCSNRSSVVTTRRRLQRGARTITGAEDLAGLYSVGGVRRDHSRPLNV